MVERVQCHFYLTFSSALVLAEYFNLVFAEHPGATPVRYNAAIELVTIALAQLSNTANWSVVEFHCFNLQVELCGCGVLVSPLLLVGVQVDYLIFSYSILRSAFESAFAYIAYRRSAKVYWESVNVVSGWFSYGVSNTCMKGRSMQLFGNVSRRRVMALVWTNCKFLAQHLRRTLRWPEHSGKHHRIHRAAFPSGQWDCWFYFCFAKRLWRLWSWRRRQHKCDLWNMLTFGKIDVLASSWIYSTVTCDTLDRYLNEALTALLASSS